MYRVKRYLGNESGKNLRKATKREGGKHYPEREGYSSPPQEREKAVIEVVAATVAAVETVAKERRSGSRQQMDQPIRDNHKR